MQDYSTIYKFSEEKLETGDVIQSNLTWSFSDNNNGNAAGITQYFNYVTDGNSPGYGAYGHNELMAAPAGQSVESQLGHDKEFVVIGTANRPVNNGGETAHSVVVKQLKADGTFDPQGQELFFDQFNGSAGWSNAERVPCVAPVRKMKQVFV